MLPNNQFITLSEAISWIAFGKPLDGSSLQRALGDSEFGNRADAETELARAVDRLADLATGESIKLRGRRVNNPGADDGRIDTETIAAIKLADFAMFDAYLDGLHRGRGLRWTAMGDNGEQLAATAGEECFLSVTVRRADLVRHFPLGNANSRNASQSKAAAERECLAWLSEAFAADPDRRKTKQSFKTDALTKWEGRLSARGFIRMWDQVAKDAGRNLPGRKS